MSNKVKIISCTICGNSFKSHNVNPKFCSKQCKGKAERANVDFDVVKELYERGLTQQEVAKELGITKKIVVNVFKRNNYQCRPAVKRNQFGENNSSWKGDKVTYEAFHKRVAVKRGKADRCTNINCDGKSKVFDWANISGDYNDINDYLMLCRTCHFKMDKIGQNFFRKNVNHRKLINNGLKLS